MTLVHYSTVIPKVRALRVMQCFLVSTGVVGVSERTDTCLLDGLGSYPIEYYIA